MKLALVHDYLNQFGGAERVLNEFQRLYPGAPIHTLLYDEKKMREMFDPFKVKTSFLQNIPFAITHHRSFLVLMPSAIEQFDFSQYDVVLSDSASYAKGVITRPDTLHICYCHTPMRYAWDDSQKYIREFPLPGAIKKILPLFISYVRMWDRQAALRVDTFIANSHFVAQRIKKYYKKEAEVIYPPVDTSYYKNEKKAGNYFLMVGRLISYKKFDLAVTAFNMLGLPLKIAGGGPEYSALKKMARANVEFLGELSGEELKRAYADSRALIFPQEEDFGLVSVEALASGRPVIAYRGGGALEIVREGENGIFFDRQTPDALCDAVRRFEAGSFDERAIAESAQKYDVAIFRQSIAAFVEKSYKEFKNKKY